MFSICFTHLFILYMIFSKSFQVNELDCNRHLFRLMWKNTRAKYWISSIGMRCARYSTSSADRKSSIIGFPEDTVYFYATETHDVPEMWAMEETMFTEATSCSQRCSTTLHYKRGKQWQRKIIIHLIFTIQPDNLTYWVVFVVFVSLFDKTPNAELPFNKEGALPFCSPKNQQSTGGRRKTAYQIRIHYFCLSQCEK